MKMKNKQYIPFIHLKCIFGGTKKQQTKLFEWIEIFNFQYLRQVVVDILSPSACSMP